MKIKLIVIFLITFLNSFGQKLEYKIVENPDIIDFEGTFSSSNYFYKLKLQYFGCCTNLICDTQNEYEIEVKSTYGNSEIEINSKKFNLVICTKEHTNIKRGTLGLVDESGFFYKKTEQGNEGYYYPEASFIKFNEDDISNLTFSELKIVRNELYAKHGYKFNNENIATIFYKKEWYKKFESKGGELTKNVILSDIEKHNVEIIRKVETNKKQ
ncbi:hypothetical protein GCM10022393_09140 [Aquimarina addita]|uniref:YARHG domain-containing protein n=1 Tax=Aquimarina addita TaxID=870485 RepID=A0ABP7XD01_9FLAO